MTAQRRGSFTFLDGRRRPRSVHVPLACPARGMPPRVRGLLQMTTGSVKARDEGGGGGRVANGSERAGPLRPLAVEHGKRSSARVSPLLGGIWQVEVQQWGKTAMVVFLLGLRSCCMAQASLARNRWTLGTMTHVAAAGVSLPAGAGRRRGESGFRSVVACLEPLGGFPFSAPVK